MQTANELGLLLFNSFLTANLLDEADSKYLFGSQLYEVEAKNVQDFLFHVKEWGESIANFNTSPILQQHRFTIVIAQNGRQGSASTADAVVTDACQTAAQNLIQALYNDNTNWMGINSYDLASISYDQTNDRTGVRLTISLSRKTRLC
jgi:hypothetical protein